MTSYWVIVRRGRAELLEILATAFRNREGFHVIEDRRTMLSVVPTPDRRSHARKPTMEDFWLAEREGPFEFD